MIKRHPNRGLRHRAAAARPDFFGVRGPAILVSAALSLGALPCAVGAEAVISSDVLYTSTQKYTDGLRIENGADVRVVSHDQDAIHGNPVKLLFEGTQTLGGSGTVTLDGDVWAAAVESTGGTLTVGSGVTVRTVPGSYASVGGTITNLGTLRADGSAAILRITGELTNGGTLEATGGGNLWFDKAPAVAGEIRATDALLVLGTNVAPGALAAASLTRSRIVVPVDSTQAPYDNAGKTLDVSAAASVLAPVAALYYGGTIRGGRIVSSDGLPVPIIDYGGIEQATVDADVLVTGGKYLGLGGSTLNGAGRVTSGGQLRVHVSTVNAPIAVEPGGGLSLYGGWVNNSAITIDSGRLWLSTTYTEPAPTNNGTITVTGGEIYTDRLAAIPHLTRTGGGAAYFMGSLTQAAEATLDLGATPFGAMGLADAEIQRGAIVSSSTIIVAPATSGSGVQRGTLLNGVTLKSPTEVVEGGYLSVGGTSSPPKPVTVRAGLTVRAGGRVAGGFLLDHSTVNLLPGSLPGATQFSGSGTVLLGSDLSRMTIEPGVTVRVTHPVQMVNGGSPTVNRGVIAVDTPGASLTIGDGFSNDNGTVTVANGATVHTTAYRLDGSKGAWVVGNGGNLHVTDFALKTNFARLTLSGPDSRCDALDAIETNAAPLTLTDGRVFATVGGLTNASTITLGPDAELRVNGTLTMTAAAGRIAVDGGTLRLNGQAGLMRTLVARAYAAGRWTPHPSLPSIYTTLAGSHAATGVGIFDSGSGVLVRATWLGDTNLDGLVDSTDRANIEAGFLLPAGSRTWAQGDFNYDQKLTADDLAMFALGAALGGSAPFGSAVPEPASLSALAWASAAATALRVRRPGRQ